MTDPVLDYIEWILEMQEQGHVQNVRWSIDKDGISVNLSFQPTKPIEHIVYNPQRLTANVDFSEIVG